MPLVMPALTFPREMPVLENGHHPFQSASFDPAYTQARASTRGGYPQVVDLAPDLWSMTFATHALEYLPAQQYLAWLQSLRGGRRLFKAWHPLCRYLRAYPNGWTGLTRSGGGAFDGTANLSAIGGARDTITLDTLPNNFVFTTGDMISIAMGAASRTLHRVMADVTANGAGVATLTVEPIVPLAVTTGVQALVEKPWCLAVVDADSIQGPFEKGQIARVQFSAMQTY